MMKNHSTYFMLLVLTPSCIALADTTVSSAADETAKELSVAPLDHVEYPQTRPDWVEQSLEIDKNSVRIVVVSGPSETAEESLEDLRLMQRAAVSTYIAQLTESGLHDFYPISDEQIEDELIVRRYEGEVTKGDTVMYEHAVEIAFTQDRRDEILSAYTSIEVRDRLAAIGVLVTLALAGLICSSVLIGAVSRRVERQDQLKAA